MWLGCTKKLLDYLGVKPEKATESVEPILEWTANLIVINRRKTLVAVHTASRSVFVIHGLTTKVRRQLPERILEGTQPYPHCIQAVGDAPMENSGGPDGFAEIRMILQDPAHPLNKEIADWIRGTWWHPLDVSKISFRMKNTWRRCIPVY